MIHIMISLEGVQYRGGTQIIKDFPHGTDPTVLKIFPHINHDIPHGTEHMLYRVRIHRVFCKDKQVSKARRMNKTERLQLSQ